MKILVIRLSSIGDIFHTFTVLPDIKDIFPSSSIDWLVDDSFKNIAELSPLINNVISIPLRKWKKSKLTWFFNVLKFKKSIKNRKYDYIIDTQGLIKTAILARILFNGPLYGLNKYSAREPIASFFYDYKFSVDQNNIAVIRLRGLIVKIFNLEHQQSKINFQIKREDCKIDYASGFILFLHGTSKENKKWPAKFWCETAIWLIKNTRQQILISYSNQQELDFANCLIKMVDSSRIKLINKLKFIELVDLIARADLVIGVDTGFTHLANLLAVPTLAIYLYSDPNYVGIIESTIAHNFGGYKQEVLPENLIEYIKQNKLL